jgi:glycosyltransferase 2 family protein
MTAVSRDTVGEGPALTGSWSLILRVVVAGGLTAYLFWRSEPRSVLAAGAAADWRPIGVAVLLVLADRSLMAYRWVVLLCTVEPGSRPRLGDVMRIFFVSTFVGTFLPASVGGDAVRAYSLAKLGVPAEDAVASVFMDRILGVASVLAMATIGLTFAREIAGNRAILFALGAAAAVCAATVLMTFSRRAAAVAARAVNGLPIRRARRAGERVLLSIRKYASWPGPLVNVLICSMAVQALRIVQAFYLGRALGIDASLGTYVAFVPIILLIMLLPVTFNGIGTSQAAFVWFFSRAGVPDGTAFALSVLFVALGIVGNLPGAVLFVTGSGDDRRPHGAQVTL